MRAQNRFDDLQYGIVTARQEWLRNEAAEERRARAIRRVAARAARRGERRERHLVLRLLPAFARRGRQAA